MATIPEHIEHANSLLDAGDKKAAAAELTDAANESHDPALEAEIRDIAEQEYVAAGRFRRGPWKEVIRVAEEHGAHSPQK